VAIATERQKMQAERFDEIRKEMASSALSQALEAQKPEAPRADGLVELSEDLTTLMIFCKEAIAKINSGGKSRERSLAITKLQEAAMWINEAMRIQ